MRSATTGSIDGVARECTPAESLEMFRKVCFIRHFELNVKKAYDAGLMKMPVYLSVGQEAIAAALATAYEKPFIFGQHRCHDLYLAYGGDPVALIDELLHRPTGCARGMGGSASIHSPAIGMFGHSGLMGDQVPIAVGFALGTGRRVLAVMGDASAEEDYVLAALGFAAKKKLPILFVCVDNGLSILTKVEVRRNWAMVDVARSFGLTAVEIADDPWLVMHHVRALEGRLPAFLNVHTVRHLWHGGTGTDGPPEWDRLAMIRDELGRLGLADEAGRIERAAEVQASTLWQGQLGVSR